MHLKAPLLWHWGVLNFFIPTVFGDHGNKWDHLLQMSGILLLCKLPNRREVVPPGYCDLQFLLQSSAYTTYICTSTIPGRSCETSWGGGIHVMETIFPSVRREHCLSSIDIESFDQVQLIQKQWCLSHWCYLRWLYTDERSKGRIPQRSTKGCVRTPSNAIQMRTAGIVAKRGSSVMIA